MLPEKQLAAYREFYDAARHNDILDERTTLMVHLATALAVGCDP